MKIHCLKHVPFEGPGWFAEWAGARDHEMLVTEVFDPDFTLPPSNIFDCLLVMGGPMGVHDEESCPWLAAEKQLIREAIDRGKSVIGVCLGAQLIADVCGAKVYPNDEKEIGWFPVVWHSDRAPIPNHFANSPMTVFHWHGDTFDLPAGAVHLAESTACKNQAFLIDGRILGLQFHIESTPESVATLCENCADEIEPDAEYCQSVEQISGAATEHCPTVNRSLEALLDSIFK